MVVAAPVPWVPAYAGTTVEGVAAWLCDGREVLRFAQE